MGEFNEGLNRESELVKPTSGGNTQKEIKETLRSNRVERMVNTIENIDNKSIKSNILHSIEKETIIYDRNIKPRLSNERLRELMNSLLSSSERRILPSELKEQFDTYIYEQVKAEIPTIDNEIIRGNIEYFYENKSFYIPERLLEEINIYNQDIKPRLSNKRLRGIFDLILSIKNMKAMPSYIKNQFDVYEELIAIENPGAKKIISRYLGEGALPTFVKEEYEVYTTIEEQEFENEEEKKYLLKLMQDGKRPKEVDAGII